MLSLRFAGPTLALLHLFVYPPAGAEPKTYCTPLIAEEDSSTARLGHSTSLTVYGGVQRGMRMKQEIEAPDKYNWLFGISLIPSLGTRWKLPIDLSLWKWQPSEAEKISGRANISVAFDILQEDNVTLFLAGGVGVFVSPGFPIAWDVGGGMEYHLSESLGFSLGIHTLIRYNKDQHPSPKAFTSPIFLSVGVMFTRPRE